MDKNLEFLLSPKISEFFLQVAPAAVFDNQIKQLFSKIEGRQTGLESFISMSRHVPMTKYLLKSIKPYMWKPVLNSNILLPEGTCPG